MGSVQYSTSSIEIYERQTESGTWEHSFDVSRDYLLCFLSIIIGTLLYSSYSTDIRYNTTINNDYGMYIQDPLRFEHTAIQYSS